MENISELSIEQIEARISEIVSEFGSLNLSADSSDEDIAKGEALATEVRELQAEQTRRNDRAESLSRMNADIEAAAKKPEPVEEPAPEPVAEVEETVEEPVVEEPVAVAASTTPTRRAAANAPAMKIPARPMATITAAADVPNYAAGHSFDSLLDAAEAVISRARSMPTHYSANTRLRYGAVKVEKQGFGDLVQGTFADDVELVMAAGNEKRLPGGSLALTADAWCAPSETLYDLCEQEVATGLLSVPEIKITRGGIRYTTGPDFSSIFTDPDFYFHVAADGTIKDGAGVTKTTKPCGSIDCPSFTEERLTVDGVCVSVDILSNVGFPELTKRVIAGVLVAHERKMNAANIKEIEVAAGAGIVAPDNSTLLFNLDYLEWYAENMRTSYSLAANASVEVILPSWIRPLIRAELGRRNGVEYVNVNDAFINTYFSVRNLSVQFVRDWQSTSGTPGSVAVPAAAKVLIYPAGAWVRGTQAVISLDTIYDSALLAQNKYLGLFTEEASLMVQRCLGTSMLQVPVSVSGLTGAQVTEVLGTNTP